MGGKIGYFLSRPVLGGNVGAEVEFYHVQPRATRQTVMFTGAGLAAPPSGRMSVQSADFEIYTLALQLVYRMPFLSGAEFPYGRVQAYGGAGGGAFIATMHTRTSPLDVNRKIEATDTQPGVQALGGLKLFVLHNVALFAEYRYAQTAQFTFDFKQQGTVGGAPATERARDRSDSTQHQAALGIAVHW